MELIPQNRSALGLRLYIENVLLVLYMALNGGGGGELFKGGF